MSMKNRAYMGFMITLALAGLILLNVIAGIWADRNGIRLDLTAQGLHTLSGETRALLDGMEHNIDIFILGAEAEWQGDPYTRRIAENLRGYEAASGGRIKVEYLDPDTTPDLASRFETIPDLYRNDIIIEGPYRYTRVSPADLYEHDYNADRTAIIPVRLNAESALLSELRFVLVPTAGHVYFLHNNREMHEQTETLRTHMIQLGFLWHPLDLEAEGVPEDADILVSAAPREDFHPGDIGKINEFVEAGGLFMMFYLQDGRPRPHLDRLLSGWGVRVEPYTLLDARNEPPEHLRLRPNWSGLRPYPILSAYADMAAPIHLVAGHPVSLLWPEGERDGRVSRTLFETGATAQTERIPDEEDPETVDTEPGPDPEPAPEPGAGEPPIPEEDAAPGGDGSAEEETGPFAAVVVTEPEAGAGAMLVSSGALVHDLYGMSPTNAPDNLALFTALIRQFALEDDGAAAIPAKPLWPEPVQVSDGQGLFILIALVYVLPMLIFIPGLWYVHRRKKRR